MLTDAEAVTIAVTVQALLTGAQFVTFLLCLPLHICPDDDPNTPFTRKNIRWPMLIITILIMAFGIVDLGCTLQTRLLGLKNDGDQLSTTIIAITNAAKASMAVAIDGVLIYRCWVVYHKCWQITVLPLLLLLYNFSCIFTGIYLTASSGPEMKVIPFTQIFSNPRIGHIEEAFLVATIIINIYATSAIIIKICRDTIHGPNHCMKRAFVFAIRIVAESGLMYTITSIAVVCALFSSDLLDGTPFPLLISAAIFPPVSGIAYNLIWIRVAHNRAKPQSIITLKSNVVEDDR
ncbi:hypothetical protein F5887DRAFT_972137 [Amanita rubescens]|nr:hypothetical protein F5887DRAFT_972137 [Amanita rubescens]